MKLTFGNIYDIFKIYLRIYILKLFKSKNAQ